MLDKSHVSSALLDVAKLLFKLLHHCSFYLQCAWKFPCFHLLSNTWYFQICYFLLVWCMWNCLFLMFSFELPSLLMSLSVLSNIWFSTDCPYPLPLSGFSLSYWLEDFLWWSRYLSFIGYMLSSSSLWPMFKHFCNDTVWDTDTLSFNLVDFKINSMPNLYFIQHIKMLFCINFWKF